MFGIQIKTYLDENGIKYSFIANELGVSITLLSTMLNGKRKITVEEYFNICNILKVDGNFFLERMRCVS